MKIVSTMIGSLMLAALPLAAQAEDMSYSYIDVNWVNLDVDEDVFGVSDSADGFGARGSIGFAKNFFGFAEYRTVEGDVGGTDYDIDQMSVGFGGRYGITDRMDLVGRLGYTEVDLSVTGLGSADDDGYLASAGLRGRVTDSFELEGHVIHTDFDEIGDDTSFAVGGRYFFTTNFAVDAGFESGDNFEIWHVGARWAF